MLLHGPCVEWAALGYKLGKLPTFVACAATHAELMTPCVSNFGTVRGMPQVLGKLGHAILTFDSSSESEMLTLLKVGCVSYSTITHNDDSFDDSRAPVRPHHWRSKASTQLMPRVISV